jgi:hypothetical protein
MDALQGLVLEAYDRIIGSELSDVVVDGCITKIPCGGEQAGRNPVDRGKRGTKPIDLCRCLWHPTRSIATPANRHDSPRLDETLTTLETLGLLPVRVSVHLDRGYDSETTREKLKARSLIPTISEKGKPAPLAATRRWVVERTNS